MTVRRTVRTGGKACIAMHEILVPLPKQRRHLLRCLFCFGIRIMIRAQTFEQRLFSRSEKDCAYRVRGILPCEEMSLPLCKSGTIFAKHTPSGKLCISYTPLACFNVRLQNLNTKQKPTHTVGFFVLKLETGFKKWGASLQKQYYRSLHVGFEAHSQTNIIFIKQEHYMVARCQPLIYLNAVFTKRACASLAAHLLDFGKSFSLEISKT